MDFVQDGIDLVSIIIPHYKVDMTYLRQCIDSIILQTYQKLEIIIVDDGNTENIAEQIDKMALIDKRILVLHQKNQGVSAARNAAMEVARGEWIMFCDPDDWMVSDKVELLLNTAKENKADIAFGRFYKLVDDLDLVKDCDRKFIIDTPQKIDDLIKKLLLLDGIVKNNGMVFCLTVVWNCLYSRNILENVRFPDRMHPIEDEIFNLYALNNSKRIVFLGKKLHYYRNNAGIGVMRRFQPNTLYNFRYAEQERKRFVQERYGGREKYFEDAEIALRSIRIVTVLCRRYFFHNKNTESYLTRRIKLERYIYEEMPFFENIKIRDILDGGGNYKHVLLFYMIKKKVYFPLEICWHVIKR